MALNLNDTLKDNYSHYTLKLAFCREQEAKKWLIKQESILFKSRFESATSQAKAEFLRDFNMHTVTKEELNNIILQIQDASGISAVQESVYKVAFDQALDLVANRQVFVKKGFAYVCFRDVVAIVTAAFRARLSKSLTEAYRTLQNNGAHMDENIQKLLALIASGNLFESNNVADFKLSGSKFEAISVDLVRCN
jgi:DNA primase large subunit